MSTASRQPSRNDTGDSEIELTGHHAWVLGRTMKFSLKNDSVAQEMVTALAGLGQESEMLRNQWTAYTKMAPGSEKGLNPKTRKEHLRRLQSTSPPSRIDLQPTLEALSGADDVEDPLTQYTLATRVTSLSHLHRGLSSQAATTIEGIESYVKGKHLEYDKIVTARTVRAAMRADKGKMMKDSERRKLTADFHQLKRYRSSLEGTRIFHTNLPGSQSKPPTDSQTASLTIAGGDDITYPPSYSQRAISQAQERFWLPDPTVISQAAALRRQLLVGIPDLEAEVLRTSTRLGQVVPRAAETYWEHPQWQLGMHLWQASISGRVESSVVDQNRLKGGSVTTSAAETQPTDDRETVEEPLGLASSPDTRGETDTISIASTNTSSPRTWVFASDGEGTSAEPVTPLSEAEKDIRQIVSRYSQEYDPNVSREADNLALVSDTLSELIKLNETATTAVLSDVHIPSIRKGADAQTFSFKSEQHAKRVMNKSNKATANRLKEVMRERRSYRDDITTGTRKYFSSVTERIKARSAEVTRLRETASLEAGVWLDRMADRIEADETRLDLMSAEADMKIAKLHGSPQRRFEEMILAKQEALSELELRMKHSELRQLELYYDPNHLATPKCPNEVFAEADTLRQYEEGLKMEEIYRWEADLGRAIDDDEEVDGEGPLWNPESDSGTLGKGAFEDGFYLPSSFFNEAR